LLFELFTHISSWVADISSQLTGFKVEIQPTGGAPPIQIYDNTVAGDTVTRPIRIENITTNFPFVIERVIVKKPTAPLTLCEVKVFAGKHVLIT
jgi:hypothetical protein